MSAITGRARVPRKEITCKERALSQCSLQSTSESIFLPISPKHQYCDIGSHTSRCYNAIHSIVRHAVIGNSIYNNNNDNNNNNNNNNERHNDNHHDVRQHYQTTEDIHHNTPPIKYHSVCSDDQGYSSIHTHAHTHTHTPSTLTNPHSDDINISFDTRDISIQETNLDSSASVSMKRLLLC
eukprot:GHVR01007855.1.p1 GENE.GHVR01007855.1~~GHVR01007855.1.p1  ORF type:complete len:202 (+),score=82.58 GHVR01007855.1:65-607(+)